MNAPSIDITALLDGNSSLGLVSGTDLFYGDMPDNDVANHLCVGVYDVPGESPDLYLDGEVDKERPMVQLLIRGNPRGFNEAYNLAAAARDALHGQHNITEGGARYLHIKVSEEIMFLKYDERDRPMFSVNLSIIRTTA